MPNAFRTKPKWSLTRRSLLAGIALFAAASLDSARLAAAASKRHKPVRHTARASSTEVPKLSGTPLPIPPLLDLASGSILDLKATPVSHAFLPGKPVEVVGYNGVYPGPTIRFATGATLKPHVVNGLDRPTNLHWHGLLVDPIADAALIAIPPGDTWETTLDVRQPAATLWYHEHMLNRPNAVRPAGLMLVTDPESLALSLPATYGIDDFPIILDDRTFDQAGNPIDEAIERSSLLGPRGASVLVNGVVDALLKVPQRFVRLRIVNAARARVFRLFMDDERSFHLVAGDGGYTQVPIEIDTLILAPGERAEIIVNFADGSTSLMSTPDAVDARIGTDLVHQDDAFSKPFRVLAFDAVKDANPGNPLPAQLPTRGLAAAPDGTTHRQFEFKLNADTVGQAASLTINGKTFDQARVDVDAKRGTSEIWHLVAPDMAEAVHITGVQFHVLAENGGPPRAWNRCAKDTVFVETSVDVLVTFTLPAASPSAYFIEASVPEQASAGAMATVVVG